MISSYIGDVLINWKTANGIKHRNVEFGCNHNNDSKKWFAYGYYCGGKGGVKVIGIPISKVCAPRSWDYYLDGIG